MTVKSSVNELEGNAEVEDRMGGGRDDRNASSACGQRTNQPCLILKNSKKMFQVLAYLMI